MEKTEEAEFIDLCIQTIQIVQRSIEGGTLQSEVEGSEDYKRGRRDGYLTALNMMVEAFQEFKKRELVN